MSDRYVKSDTGEVFEHIELDPERATGLKNNSDKPVAVTMFAKPGEHLKLGKTRKRPSKTKAAFTMVYDDELRLLMPTLSPNEALVMWWLAPGIQFGGTTQYDKKRLTVGKLVKLLPWSKTSVAREAIESLEAKNVVTRVYQNSRIVYVDVNPTFCYKGGNADGERQQAIQAFYDKVAAARAFRHKAA